MAESVRVICRCRPLNQRELALNSKVSFDFFNVGASTKQSFRYASKWIPRSARLSYTMKKLLQNPLHSMEFITWIPRLNKFTMTLFIPLLKMLLKATMVPYLRMVKRARVKPFPCRVLKRLHHNEV